jgi:WD40 repeat protein
MPSRRDRWKQKQDNQQRQQQHQLRLNHSPPRYKPETKRERRTHLNWLLRNIEIGKVTNNWFKNVLQRERIDRGFKVSNERQFGRVWQGGVNCVELCNATERFLLAGTVDGTVCAFDSLGFRDREDMSTVSDIFASNRRYRNENTDKKVRTSEGHAKSVSAVAWYPHDSNCFFSGSFDGTVKLWDASRVEVAITYNSCSSSSSGSNNNGGSVEAAQRIRDVSLSLSSHLNNDLVAIATDEANVNLWDPGSNVVAMVFAKAHPAGCSKIAWSKENAFSVITCGFEGRCAVWDARRCAIPLFSMDRRRTVHGNDGSGENVRNPIGYYDENARAHADGIESVLLHPNGRSVFTKGFGSRGDARIREFDLRTGRCDATKFERFSKKSSVADANGTRSFSGPVNAAASQYWYSTTMSCSEDGVNIFVPLQDGSIIVYDARTGAILERLKCHADRVTSVQFANRECELFSSSMDGFLVRWKGKSSASKNSANTIRDDENDWSDDAEDKDIGVGMYRNRNVRARA